MEMRLPLTFYLAVNDFIKKNSTNHVPVVSKTQTNEPTNARTAEKHHTKESLKRKLFM